MWGSSFADLAKQAAELQEQAAKKRAEWEEQAAHVVENVPSAKEAGFTSPVGFGSAGGFFNMDILQQNEQQAASAAPQTPVATEAPQEISEPTPPLSQASDGRNEEQYEEVIAEEDQEALEKAWKERQLQMQQEKQPVDSAHQEEPATATPEPEQDGEQEEGNSDVENEENRVKEVGEKAEDQAADDAGVPQPVVMDHDDTNDTETPTGAALESNERAAALEPPVEEEVGPSTSQESIPEHVLDKFSEQLKRLEENHAAEKTAIQEQHNHEMRALQQNFSKAQHNLQQTQVNNKRSKEGYTLKLDALQRELRGTQELLQDKDKEFKRLQEQHLKQLRGMEKQIFKQEDESQGNVNRVRSLEKELEESHAAVEASKEEYNTLKERTKVVASELKERRAACRTLASEVDVLKSNNSNLQDQMTQMQGESLDMNQSSQVNEQELNTLKSQLMDIKKELEEARAGIQKVAEKGEEALTSYKKKAQQSLAVANARAANAAQAREEAEMESRAARSTADKAMERALMAEQNGKEAQAKAKLYVTDMEKEVAKYSEVKEALEKATSELEQVRAESKSLTETNAKQTCELQSVSGRFEASQKTVEDLNKELSESQTRSNELFEETERLRHEVQRLKDDFQRLSLAMESNDAEEKKDYMEQAKQVSLNSEAEATISMLRQELHDANIAIKELKETLIATVEESEAALSNPQSQPSPPMNGDGGGGIPLFYAMEKQAELTQARNEITRLANLLGDSETDKQEAMDSMQEMERRMNEAMAKLKRQEQHDKFSPQEEQVNMEYLKNVTLSFVKAATVVEKKALLPVIGTVLCLTPEEQSRAMEALDKNGSGVMESVTSSVMSLGWGS